MSGELPKPARRDIMQGRLENLDFEHFNQVFTLLGRTTDDYLFIFDLEKDVYAISETAVKRFALKESRFSDATSVLKGVCHPDDWSMLGQNIAGIRNRTIKEHDLEYRWMSKKGFPVWISCRGQLIFDNDGQVRYMVGRITELGRKNPIDNVTELYREVRFRSDLSKLQSLNQKNGYLLQIGIDNFREINDKYGKEMGNEVLFSVAESIRMCVKEKGTVYRMDGDEMAILVLEAPYSEEEPARKLYHEIRSRVDLMISTKGYQLFYTISGGSAYFYQADENNAFSLMEKAEFALHLAKQRGRNTYIAYDNEEYKLFVERLDMQEKLRQSVMDGFQGFELYYQPIVNIQKKKILGAEALLRWRHEKFGMVSPAEFIPLLEESGLIIPVGRWIIKTAMNQCKKWKEADGDFRININLSFIQIKKSNIISDIDDCMKELDFDSRNVLFEITESGELEEGYMTKRILESFQRRKLNLAIDDFGTGYSNLRYIKEMMFDLVKIDREFIKNITQSQYDYLVVKQFTELSHSLNLRVCYEGVETYEDLQCVLQLKPDYIQGFYFAKPVTAGIFEKEYLCKELEF